MRPGCAAMLDSAPLCGWRMPKCIPKAAKCIPQPVLFACAVLLAAAATGLGHALINEA